MTQPALVSLALADIPRPDFADVSIRPLPDGAPLDPETWARAIFNSGRTPMWIKVLMGLRQATVGLIGVPRANADEAFRIRERVGDEVLLAADDRHLDFRVGVGVDPVARLVRVTTTVRLHGWRGRLYFAPVRLLHPPIVQAMMRSAAHRLA
jgi:hypothetical protein